VSTAPAIVMPTTFATLSRAVTGSFAADVSSVSVSEVEEAMPSELPGDGGGDEYGYGGY
jgi:hypothetical protein